MKKLNKLKDLLIRIIIDFFFTKSCYGCSRFGTYLCSKCIRDLKLINLKQICPICKKEIYIKNSHTECNLTSSIDSLISIFNYSKPIDKMISDIKYKGYYQILDRFSEVMSEYIRSDFKNEFKDLVICFVPIHWSKKNLRGFNQSELLSLMIGKKLNIPVVEGIKKTKATRAQVELTRDKRVYNLKDSFSINLKNIHLIKEKNIILIDDVFTTGTTMMRCGLCLKENQVNHVYGVVIAR